IQSFGDLRCRKRRFPPTAIHPVPKPNAEREMVSWLDREDPLAICNCGIVSFAFGGEIGADQQCLDVIGGGREDGFDRISSLGSTAEPREQAGTQGGELRHLAGGGQYLLFERRQGFGRSAQLG